jgi:hypothetical protein
VVDGLADVFGPFPATATPQPIGPFAPKKRRPALTQFKDRPESDIPAAIKDGDRWFFWIGKTVKVINQTRRMQTATDDAPSVGLDLMPATADESAAEFFAAWGSIAKNGRPFVHTFFDTVIWLDDTDFGISD